MIHSVEMWTFTECNLYYYKCDLIQLYYVCCFKVVEAGSDESLSANEDSPKRGRHDALTRRPSYRKILNDIAGCYLVY